jgi:hypothetical protein
MDTLRKQIRIFKINPQISALNHELAQASSPRPFFASGHFYQPASQPERFIRESEKSFLLRESVDQLKIRKAKLRKG